MCTVTNNLAINNPDRVEKLLQTVSDRRDQKVTFLRTNNR